MARAKYNVLFLCTGNSARSVMAEALLNDLGRDHFQAYSAGSHPAGQINPYTTDVLKKNGHDVSGLRSKSWDEFAARGAPRMDFVITVCDNAAGEVCPLWPGRPMTAHWGFEDPAAAQGSDEEKREKFRAVYHQVARRLALFLSLPIDRLDRMALGQQVRDMGKSSA